MRAIFFLLFSLTVLETGFCQKTDYSKFQGTKVKCGLDSRLEKPYFKEYGALRKSVKIKTIGNEKLGNGPEQVLADIYVSKSESDLKKYFSKNAKVNAKAYKQSFTIAPDTSKNFLLLKHKLTFNITETTELAIIKYSQYVDSVEVQEHIIQVINENGKWVAVKIDEYEEEDYILLNVSAKEFWSLNKRGKLTESDAPISESVLNQVKDAEGVLNLTNLASLIKQRKKAGNKEIFKN